MSTIVAFPPIVLVSTFTYWTIGPISKTSDTEIQSICHHTACHFFKDFNSTSYRLSVSFGLTWVNVFLSKLPPPVFPVAGHGIFFRERERERESSIFFLFCLYSNKRSLLRRAVVLFEAPHSGGCYEIEVPSIIVRCQGRNLLPKDLESTQWCI